VAIDDISLRTLEDTIECNLLRESTGAANLEKKSVAE
jgi:hypothetical protein